MHIPAMQQIVPQLDIENVQENIRWAGWAGVAAMAELAGWLAGLAELAKREMWGGALTAISVPKCTIS